MSFQSSPALDNLAPYEAFELRNMNDTTAEPLIRPNLHEDTPDTDFTREYDDNARRFNSEEVDVDVDVDESQLVSPGWFIWCLTLCAGISGLLFGYEYVHNPRLIHRRRAED